MKGKGRKGKNGNGNEDEAVEGRGGASEEKTCEDTN